MTTTQIQYTVRPATEEEAEGESLWWMVIDKDGDTYDGYASPTEAIEEAERLNANLEIVEAVEELQGLLDSLTESHKASTLKAIKAMIATAENLE